MIDRTARKRDAIGRFASPSGVEIDVDAVREETIRARRLYEKEGWPVIDVTRRSVEETAAAIINLLTAGRGQVELLA